MPASEALAQLYCTHGRANSVIITATDMGDPSEHRSQPSVLLQLRLVRGCHIYMHIRQSRIRRSASFTTCQPHCKQIQGETGIIQYGYTARVSLALCHCIFVRIDEMCELRCSDRRSFPETV